ncbi:hypothetical protein BDK92_5848 [Micromonospora pisi]|uniref:Uncharacterized protein n=1 Tax=Micromonospora pisi TaxID=589240 RepID=A0A495JSV8_9ACTN|nr:hypothetical protein [Micromonospora pisi]RKR91452.1 hypothetical protein BDK92_5848 [Micromonospora pisi]
MNSTRRKWFLNPDDPAPVEQSVPAPAPAPPPMDGSRRELVTLTVAAATIGGARRYGAGTGPARRNGGRWPA